MRMRYNEGETGWAIHLGNNLATAKVSEMLSICWKDVSMTPGQENVRVKTLKRKNHWREIPLDDPALLTLLKDYRAAEVDPNEHVFSLNRQQVTNMVKQYAKRAGLETNAYAHILRHTFAVERLKQGLDLRSLQRLLGHAKLESTALYLELTNLDIREAVERAPLRW